MSLNLRKTKKCPRCGNDCLLSQAQCDECGLIFSRVAEATNKDAKRRLYRHQKDKVIYIKGYPSDIKKWKLILLTIFCGLFGVHYFYVGRLKMGFFMMIYFMLVVLMGVVFNSYFINIWSGQFFNIFGPITGVYTLVWLNDIRRVCFSSFKIPVSILKEDENKEYLDLQEKIKEAKKNLKKKKRKEIKNNEYQVNNDIKQEGKDDANEQSGLAIKEDEGNK